MDTLTDLLTAKIRQLETTLDLVGAYVFTKDMEGRYTYANKMMCDFFGCTLEQVIGATDEEFFDLSTSNELRSNDRRVLDQGERLEAEEIKVTKSGEARIYWSVKLPLHGPEGPVVGLCGVSTDVTEQKKINQAMHESEERHRILFMDSPDAYLIIRDGVFVDCNRATEAMLRGDRSQIIGRTPDALSPEFQPDGKRSSRLAQEKLEEALRNGSHSFVWVHRRLDGTDFFVEVNIAPMLLEGKKTLFTSWRDITERKQAEEALVRSEMKFRTLFNFSRDAVMLLNEDGFFDCNRACLDMFGCATLQEFCTTHPGLVSPPLQPSGMDSFSLANRNIAIAMNTGSHSFEWVHQRIDNGRLFTAEVLLSAMELDGRTVFQATVRDITERKQAEKALEEYNRKLEALSTTDGLTGIANRRRFDEALSLEYARHARSGAELSLILLDIDHFKAFNDSYGHVAGDDCLRQIGRVIAGCTARPGDLAARYGGEEFACILPETDHVGAVIIAERIRRAIQALGITHKASNVADCVTASLGAATTHCQTEGSVTNFVAQADDLLYRAKSLGRNRVESMFFQMITR